jgi:hypothetical protein
MVTYRSVLLNTVKGFAANSPRDGYDWAELYDDYDLFENLNDDELFALINHYLNYMKGE